MTRVGINPARDQQSAYQPTDVTLTMVVHIPALLGYHRYRLRILQQSLKSLLDTTGSAYDVLIFNNGSCPEVVEYLQSLQVSGFVRYVLSSRENIGKMGAFKLLFQAAPGRILAYSDDDIFFYSGWLERCIQILETFPNVGMVSAFPGLAGIDSRNISTLAFAETEAGVEIEYGRAIPREWSEDFALSTGRDPQEWLRRHEQTKTALLRYRGVAAYATANHFQFVGYRAHVLQALPEDWTGKLMREMRDLDEGIDNLGLLRLATPDRLIRHMGNMLDEEREIELGMAQSTSPGWVERFLEWRFVRWFLQGLYNRLFWLLNRPQRRLGRSRDRDQ